MVHGTPGKAADEGDCHPMHVKSTARAVPTNFTQSARYEPLVLAKSGTDRPFVVVPHRYHIISDLIVG